MAEMKEGGHDVVEILVDKQIMPGIQDHPPSSSEAVAERRRCIWASKETRLDTLRREIFQICLFFFMFQGLFSTIFVHIFCEQMSKVVDSDACIFIDLLYADFVGYRALTRCIQELRIKGASFDLSKEPGSGNRIKSSSVEIKWNWCSQYLITICLVCLVGLAVPVCRFMLCA